MLQYFFTLQPLRERPELVRQMAKARGSEWVVYAKVPFAGPGQVLDYVLRGYRQQRLTRGAPG